MGVENFEWVAKNVEGSTVCLLCLWNCDTLTLDKSYQGLGFLGLFIPFVTVKVRKTYGAIWTALLITVWQLCVRGDFNVIISKEEKRGCQGIWKAMEGFKEFIAKTRIIDLLMIGRSFTWYQPNKKAMSCLDRFLMNMEWLPTWDLKRSISDQCSMLLIDKVKN